MGDVYNLILQHANASAVAGNWVAVAATLNDATAVQKTDSTPRDSEYVATILGRVRYRTFADALAANTDRVIQDNRVLLLSKGWNFNSNEVRQIVDDLTIANAIKTDLKAIGRWRVSIAQEFLGRAVTEQECQSEYTAITLENWVTDRSSNALSQIRSGNLTDLTAVKAYLAG